jgi:hypothetical protein
MESTHAALDELAEEARRWRELVQALIDSGEAPASARAVADAALRRATAAAASVTSSRPPSTPAKA